MTRRRTTFRDKNRAPRSLIDETTYREHGAAVNSGVHDTSTHSGWSHATRPRDQAIFVRKHRASSTVPSGPT